MPTDTFALETELHNIADALHQIAGADGDAVGSGLRGLAYVHDIQLQNIAIAIGKGFADLADAQNNQADATLALAAAINNLAPRSGHITPLPRTAPPEV